MIRALLCLTLLASSLAGCSVSDADRSAAAVAAEQGVSKFHQQLDAGRFEEIYAGTSDEVKKSGSLQEFASGLEAIHRKLGASKSTKQQTGVVSVGTPGTMVTLNYVTTYTGGDANEQFVFLIHGNVPSLAGYHINSKALEIK